MPNPALTPILNHFPDIDQPLLAHALGDENDILKTWAYNKIACALDASVPKSESEETKTDLELFEQDFEEFASILGLGAATPTKEIVRSARELISTLQAIAFAVGVDIAGMSLGNGCMALTDAVSGVAQDFTGAILSVKRFEKEASNVSQAYTDLNGKYEELVKSAASAPQALIDIIAIFPDAPESTPIESIAALVRERVETLARHRDQCLVNVNTLTDENKARQDCINKQVGRLTDLAGLIGFEGEGESADDLYAAIKTRLELYVEKEAAYRKERNEQSQKINSLLDQISELKRTDKSEPREGGEVPTPTRGRKAEVTPTGVTHAMSDSAIPIDQKAKETAIEARLRGIISTAPAYNPELEVDPREVIHCINAVIEGASQNQIAKHLQKEEAREITGFYRTMAFHAIAIAKLPNPGEKAEYKRVLLADLLAAAKTKKAVA